MDGLCDMALGDGAPVAWFAPTYKMQGDVWRELTERLHPYTRRSNVTERRIELITGGVIDLWSLDSPDAGRGRRYARVVLDEAAMVATLLDAWNSAIRPTLTDFRGDAWFLSTPKGRNGFYQLWLNGVDEEQPEWASWQMPTATNPFIQAEEIEAAKRMMPDRVFQQEYMAEFLEDSAVFRHVMTAARAKGQDKPVKGHRYVIGCDWGKLDDFSVFVVMDATNREMAHMLRLNEVDYVTQADRLEHLVDKWKPAQVVTETTGVGEPIADILRARSIGIRRFQTTRKSKEELIGWLIKAFDEHVIGILSDAVLLGELQMMEARPTSTGFRYTAPEGYHDDCVMALALAWDGVRKSGTGARVMSRRTIA
jgi:phage FluMu gp28-like protein